MMRFSLACLLLMAAPALAADANRLTYLDEFCDPYYVGLQTAQLTTPQWVGEPGVEAVIVLSVDDLKDIARYEAFIRPILTRLKQIDGRGPVSFMGAEVPPDDPRLQTWLRDGMSLEAHTVAHPCPCLQDNNIERGKATYDLSIDRMGQIPGSRPVAFRMPCCDSMNSASPRFYCEIFNQVTPLQNFLHLDSSIFTVPTPEDPALPKNMFNGDGNRFRKYAPPERRFINYVENYPYPYVISRLCWELPGATPDDWQGFNLNDRCNPKTVADMKAAIDATVVKQGVFTLVFHPHRWISAEQVIELIDHAVARYGKKVKFLNFREVYQRLTKNLLAGQPLRNGQGQDNGVRVLDVNGDGWMDVVIGNAAVRKTRIWQPQQKRWSDFDFPVALIGTDSQGKSRDAQARFGVLNPDGQASVLVRNESQEGLWHFQGQGWMADPMGLEGLEAEGPLYTGRAGRDCGVRIRDIDGDGRGELLVSNPQQNALFSFQSGKGWTRLGCRLPAGVSIVDAQGRDAGLRFADWNGDGRPDVVFSNAPRSSVYLFTSLATGWGRQLLAAPRGSAQDLPMIVRADGTNNGAWFKYGRMWVQNENTSTRPPRPITNDYFINMVQSREMGGGTK